MMVHLPVLCEESSKTHFTVNCPKDYDCRLGEHSTMNPQELVVAIFLSDNVGVVAALSTAAVNKQSASDQLNAVYKYEIDSPPGDNISELIEKLLSQVLQREPIASIAAVCIAAPGPILKSGLNHIGEENYGVIRTAYSDRKKFNSLNLVDAFRLAAERLGDKRLETISPVVIHDAAAQAVGNVVKNKPPNREWVEAHILVSRGVGGAMTRGNEVLSGHMHSELGHVPIQPHQYDIDQEFSDALPSCEAGHYHRCLEHFASERAIEARWGKDAVNKFKSWSQDSMGLVAIAHYFSQLCVFLIVSFAPSRIVFSGSIFENDNLTGSIQRQTFAQLRMEGMDEAYPGFLVQSEFESLISREMSRDKIILGCLNQACKHSLGDNVTTWDSERAQLT